MPVEGYNENIFINLTKDELDELLCSICCHILRQPHQCQNGHQFCKFCIKTWTREDQNSCPVCRVNGPYHENTALLEKLNQKLVRCEWNRCFWTGPLTSLETHLHKRSKNDVYHSIGIDTSRSRQSQRSKEVESEIVRQNSMLSEQMKKNELQCHGRFRELYKRILESKWQKLKNSEKAEHRIKTANRSIRKENSQMFDRIQRMEIRKMKEIEENKRRVKSLDIKQEQLRESFLRRLIQQEREIEEKNLFQKRRLEEMAKRREVEKEKNAQKLQEIERVKSERSERFLRKLSKEQREWKERWELLLERWKVTERKNSMKFMQWEMSSKRKEERETRE